jgi:hypothetical protein
MALKQDIEPVGGDEPPPRFSVRGWEAVRERLVGSTFPGGAVARKSAANPVLGYRTVSRCLMGSGWQLPLRQSPRPAPMTR